MPLSDRAARFARLIQASDENIASEIAKVHGGTLTVAPSPISWERLGWQYTN